MYRIAIKIAAPHPKGAPKWGDFHMALCLKEEFEILGCPTTLQCVNEWNNGADSSCDVVIALRGRTRYQPKKHHINILWNISHPDLVSIEEYSQYDYVLVSSIEWANLIKSKLHVPVEPMLQCTNPKLFKPFCHPNYRHELLFVGNTRNVYRKIINDLLPTTRDLAVYGMDWKFFIDKKYIKGSFIPNDKLYKYYGSCDILLNDHWEDMRLHGFINNRIFDALASEAFIISDEVSGLEKVVQDSVVIYHSRGELRELIDYYLAHPERRKEKAKKGARIVRNQHTYAKRSKRFLEIIQALKSSP